MSASAAISSLAGPRPGDAGAAPSPRGDGRSAAHHASSAAADARGERLSQAVYTDFRELQDDRRQWDALAQETGGDIYGTFDWCNTWWRHYGQDRELRIHVFTRGQQWVAVLPTFFEKVRLGPFPLRVVRLVGSDHSVTTCSPAIRPGAEADVLHDWLAKVRSARPDVIHLGPLAGYFESVETLIDSLPQHAEYLHRIEVGYPQMVVDLPAKFDDYLAALPKKKRGELRREERDFLARPAARCRIVDDPRDIVAAFEEFVDLHQAYWRADHRLGHFGDWPRSLEFHREILRNQSAFGRAILILIEDAGKLMAAEHCYLFGSRLHWFLSARRRDFPGRVGFCAMVREAISRGATQLDGMRGYYEYKKWLGARVVHQKSIVLIADRARSRRRFARFQKVSGALNLLYYRLWFSRLAPKLPLPRRPLRQTWIRTQM